MKQRYNITPNQFRTVYAGINAGMYTLGEKPLLYREAKNHPNVESVDIQDKVKAGYEAILQGQTNDLDYSCKMVRFSETVRSSDIARVDVQISDRNRTGSIGGYLALAPDHIDIDLSDDNIECDDVDLHRRIVRLGSGIFNMTDEELLDLGSYTYFKDEQAQNLAFSLSNLLPHFEKY